MGKKYTTDSINIGDHSLDAAMMVSLNTVVANHSNYLTTMPAHNQAWSTITSTPTTLAGYGIGDADVTGALTVSGSSTRGTTTSVSNYHSGADNIILKGNSSGISSIFFESEKNGTNINHPTDFGFIQYHAYGTSTSGEANELIIGVSNDADDHIILNAPNAEGLRFRVGNSETDYKLYHEGHKPTLAEIGAQPSGIYNTVIGTDTDVDTSGATIIDSINVTDGVITSMGTRALTLADIGAAPASHGHNYLPLTGGTLSGNLDVNADIKGNTFTQEATGIPRNNLGAPTVSEMALFDNQFTPKTTLANNYDDLTDLTFWVQTTSSSAWTEVTTYSDDQKRRFLRTNNSSVIIPNGAYKFRVEFVGRSYTFANAMYAYWSSNSHNTQVHIWKYNVANSAWTQHTSSSATVSSWPGHLYLPFSTIPWNESNTTSTGHFKSIRIEFTPNWSSGTYSDRFINLYGMQLWGGYPSGRRTVHNYDQNGKLNLYDDLNVPGDITVGGTVDGVDISALPTSFAPTTAEANVQSDWNATSGDALILNKPTILVPEFFEEKFAYQSNDLNAVYTPMVKGGLYGTSTSPVTGAIRIDLPSYQSAGMINFYVDIYEYSTGDTVTFRISGYAYNDSGATWYNCSVVNFSDDNNDYNVRFISDTANSKQCVTIGEVDTNWYYPQVLVRDAFSGYNTSESEWKNSWNITFVTSLVGTVRHNFTDNLPYADWDRLEGKPTSFAPTNAEANVQSDWNATSGDAFILNKPAIPQGDITSVVAGTGLTGGGTANAVTLNVIGGTGITANANDIAIDATVATLAGTQTFTGAKTIDTLKIGTANKIQFGNNDFIRYDDANGVGRFHFDSDGGTNNSSVQAATFVGALSGNAATASSAAKWTTARTLSLTGDASGSVSWDGSGNASLAVTVNNDSHYHSQIYIPDTRGASRAPSYYPDKHTSFDFQSSADTGAGGDAWHALQTVSPWSVYNASHRQQQIAYTGSGGLKFRYATSETAWDSWQTLWTSGNDGSGSGLDADLLDGQQGSYYLSQGSIGLSGANRISTSTNFNNSAPSGFYQGYNITNSPTGSTWYNMLNVRHSNTGNDHGFQIAASYYHGNFYTRTYQGGTGANNGNYKTWAKQWSDSNDGAGSGLDADKLDGQEGSYYYPASNPSGYTANAGDITSVTAGTNLNGGGTSGAVTLNLDTNISLDEVNIGSGIELRESSDRADLLQLTSSTSIWAGLQIRNSSNEGRWSFMTDGSTAGFYDDENNEWAVQMVENNAVKLYYNNLLKFNTNSTGIDVLGNININENIAHGGDSNTYIGFPSNDNFRVVTGGVERMKVNSSAVTISSLVPTKLVLNNTKNGTWTPGEALGLIDFYGNDASGGGAKVQSSIEVVAQDQYGAHFNMTFNLSNGSSGNTERMRLTGEGRLGIGTTNPESNIDIVGATNTGSSSLLRLRSTTALNTPEKVLGFYYGSTPTNERGYISLNQYSVTYSTSSDYRLKENIVPIPNGIERLKELKPCRFNFIQGDPNYVVDGFIAHEAQEVVPEAVTGEKDAVDEDNNPAYQGIDQSKIVPLLTAALQEAINKIEQLETRIQTLENN